MVKTKENSSTATETSKSPASFMSEDEMQEFEALYPVIIEELVQVNDEMMPEMEIITDWMVRAMNYNVCGGKKLRGLMVPVSYKSLCKNPTPESLKKAYILGWIVEMFQGASLVADDMMDNSETRRGKPCWYKVDDVGMLAVNDCFLLEISAYRLVKNYFYNDDCYQELNETIRDIVHKSIFGQALDCLMGRTQDIPQSFTMERYNAIVKYKTSFYTMILPVFLAMTLAGINKKETKEKVAEVLLEIGHYFQVQDDYLDCFGDEKVTGKIGTDIQDNKCSWLVVKALELCSPEQLKFLVDNYGQTDPNKIEKVKTLYRDLNLPKLYEEYETEAQTSITAKLKELPEDVDEEVFQQLFLKIYKRRK